MDLGALRGIQLPFGGGFPSSIGILRSEDQTRFDRWPQIPFGAKTFANAGLIVGLTTEEMRGLTRGP